MTLCMSFYIIQYDARQCFKNREMLERRNEQQMQESTYMVLLGDCCTQQQLTAMGRQKKMPKPMTLGSSKNSRGKAEPGPMALTWLHPCKFQTKLEFYIIDQSKN